MLRRHARRRAPALWPLCLLWLAAGAAGLPRGPPPQALSATRDGGAGLPDLSAQQRGAPRLAPEQLPLRTRGRFITDAAGGRVKLACVNWAAHMEALLPEGLARRPLAAIAGQIADLGFNCVRLTYAVETVQRRGQPAAAAARAQLSAAALAGLAEHNAWVLDGNASVWDVWGAAVRALGAARLLVVADNHVSDAGWCCALGDGQRWFNEARFPVQPWLHALRTVASDAAAQAELVPEWRYLIGFGLRNEVLTLEFWRAIPDWYQFMGAAAAAVAAAHPTALIVAGGTDSESLLSYIAAQPLLPPGAPGHERLVYGAHFYDGFYVQPLWQLLGEDVTCTIMTGFLDARIAVILDEALPNAAPVWLSEVGLAVDAYDPADNNADDTRWWRCLRAWMARHDIDWGFWALQGSYYVRQGVRDYNETWGLLTSDWAHLRSPALVAELRALQPRTLGRWDLWPRAQA